MAFSIKLLALSGWKTKSYKVNKSEGLLFEYSVNLSKLKNQNMFHELIT